MKADINRHKKKKGILCNSTKKAPKTNPSSAQYKTYFILLYNENNASKCIRNLWCLSQKQISEKGSAIVVYYVVLLFKKFFPVLLVRSGV